MRYIGRFAPSPTGPLHFGSLVTAVASYCDAKAHQGKWLVRMEDLDKPRTISGAAANILNMLKLYGFKWDDKIMYQSQRSNIYQMALDKLDQQKLIYPCSCSRKQILQAAIKTGIEGTIYPGTCRQQAPQKNMPKAWRIKTHAKPIAFNDTIAGLQTQTLQNNIGDFVLKRADHLFAYQLAVVVDDAAQGITHIVRGADLLNATARQIFLQQSLGFYTPTYTHIPIVKNKQGEKLSKQTQATAITANEAVMNLSLAFKFLNLMPPQALLNFTIDECWQWAFKQWRVKNISKQY